MYMEPSISAAYMYLFHPLVGFKSRYLDIMLFRPEDDDYVYNYM